MWRAQEVEEFSLVILQRSVLKLLSQLRNDMTKLLLEILSQSHKKPFKERIKKKT